MALSGVAMVCMVCVLADPYQSESTSPTESLESINKPSGRILKEEHPSYAIVPYQEPGHTCSAPEPEVKIEANPLIQVYQDSKMNDLEFLS